MSKRIESWIGVDLDGTLAHYEGWKGVEHIGEPIEPMVSQVLDWLVAGKRVKIFTARVSEAQDGVSVEDITIIIQNWCSKHIGVILEVTCVKDFGMLELWDDRCVRVVKNTGLRCCNNE